MAICGLPRRFAPRSDDSNVSLRGYRTSNEFGCIIHFSIHISIHAMSPHADAIRLQLAKGPMQVRQVVEIIGISQPTVSRAMAVLGNEIIRIGSGKSIQYALRDRLRGLDEVPVYRVSAEGTLRELGVLVPVRPDGYVMRQSDGQTIHSDGLPWWLFDMRPQGYLGRAYANRHASLLGLPSQLYEWSDTHALHALLAHGHDAVGNVLLGERARAAFLSQPTPEPVAEDDKASCYASLAEEASRGEMPGSSAGGEQPKFLVFAQTPAGPRHLIVKFTVAEDSPVSMRWRDLLLAEHLAMECLRLAGLPAAQTRVVDAASRRFLEVERFDRVGALGRRGVFSLKALDAEFVGAGQGWTSIASALATAKHIDPLAVDQVALLQAFGVLIGNTDMHTGNLAFMSEHGRPYALAPAYDMLPMAFAPSSGGGIGQTVPEAQINHSIAPAAWQQALTLAQAYARTLRQERGFSASFASCIEALEHHQATAAEKIRRLEAD